MPLLLQIQVVQVAPPIPLRSQPQIQGAEEGLLPSCLRPLHPQIQAVLEVSQNLRLAHILPMTQYHRRMNTDRRHKLQPRHPSCGLTRPQP